METRTCYICNLNVPRIYLSKHYTTDEHHFFLNITKGSLDKVNKHMTQPLKEPKLQNKYADKLWYCSDCNILLPRNDLVRDNHMKSSQHQDSMKRKSLLSDLLIRYTRSITEKNEGGYQSYATETKSDNENTNINDTKKQLDANKKMKNDLEIDGGNKIKEIQDDCKLKPREVNSLLLTNTIDVKNTIIKTNKTIEEVQRTLKDFKCSRLYLSNFAVDVSNVPKTIEDVLIESRKFLELETEHQDNASTDKDNASTDKDNASTDKDNYEDLEKCKITTFHQIQNENNITNSINISNLNETNNKHEALANTVSDTNNKVSKHMTKKSKENVSKVFLITTEGVLHVVPEYYWHGIEFLEPAYCYCTICSRYLTKNDLQMHLNTSEHLKLVHRPVEREECYRLLSQSKTHCIACNKIISSTEWNHFSTEQHKTKVLKSLIKLEFFNDRFLYGINNYESEPPFVDVGNVSRNYQEYKDQTNLTNILTHANENQESVDSLKANSNFDYVSFDELCEGTIEIEYNEGSVTITSENNEKWKVPTMNWHGLKNVNLNSLECLLCERSFKINQVEEHILNTEHSYKIRRPINQLFRMISLNDIHCIVCNDLILQYTWNDLEKHLQSSDHKQLYKTNCVYSGGCDVKGQGRLQKNHMKIPSVNDLYYCEICKLFIRKHYLSICEHLLSTKHKENVVHFLHSNKIVRQRGKIKLFCKVCSLGISGNFMTHVQSAVHKSNLVEIIERDSNFCHVCDVPVHKNNMKYHIKGKTHKRNLTIIKNPL